MKTILVTGATGFIGRRLVRSLTARGDRVIGLARSTLREPGVDVHAVDLSDASAVRAFAETIERVDATLHLAAHMPLGSIETPEAARAFAAAGVASLENLLGAFGDRLGHFVYASSIDVYGAAPNPPHAETQTPSPVTEYGTSKAIGERIVGSSGLPHAILRLAQVYGPGDAPIKVIPRFVERIRSGQPLVVVGGGHDKRRYLAVADAVRAFELVVDKAATGTFNVAGEEIVSIRDLVALFEKTLGRSLPVEEIAGAPTGDRYVTIDRAREMLGFVPAVSLEDGLRECLATASGGRKPSEG